MKKSNIIIRKSAGFLTWPGIECIRMIRGSGVRILMYHRITDEYGDCLSVSPPEFKRQMDLLVSTGYRVMTLARALADGMVQRRLPAVVITFDDGYQDFHRKVFPILRERDFPAIVFVVPDFIDGKISLRRYRDLSGDSRSVTWGMLREMQEGGITVGAHSVTHRELTELGGIGSLDSLRYGYRYKADQENCCQQYSDTDYIEGSCFRHLFFLSGFCYFPGWFFFFSGMR